MANYFIGGVGKVQAFINTERGLEHYFDAKTLTDSAISISTSSEEIRGGEGAQLLGKFFHTSVFNLNMTDALFDLKYLAAQVGSTIENGEGKHFHTEKLTINGGKVTLSYTPVPIAGGVTWCEENANTIAWYKGCDDGEYVTAVVDPTDNHISVAGEDGDVICVTYPISRAGRELVVKAMYYPKEFVVYLTTKLFAGDACAPSKGSYIGEIVVEIPRFQLDGTVDLSLNMSSAATFTLNGSAYAVGCGCDDGEDSYYAKITEIIGEEDDFYKGYTGIVILNADDIKAGDKIFIYAVARGKTPKLYRGKFTATYVDSGTKPAVDAAGKIVSGAAGKEVTVTATEENSDLTNKTATFTVQA